MRRSLLLLASIASTVVALDWWTKRWATENLARHEPVEILGPLLRFTYTRNSGVAFGLGAGLPFPYYLFSIVAVVAILYLFLRRGAQTPTRQVALSLILGGAVGNLIDRVTMGEVVDFIEIGWGRWHWPVFNLADTAVTTGVVLFALAWSRPHAPAVADAPADAPSATGTEPTGGDTTLESNPHALGRSAEQRGAAGSLPGGGAGRPLP